MNKLLRELNKFWVIYFMSTNKSALFKNLLLFSVMSILLIPSLYSGKAHGNNSYTSISTDEIANNPYLSQSNEDNLIAEELQVSNDLFKKAKNIYLEAPE